MRALGPSLALSVIAAACTASETGNPVGGRSMTLLARSSDGDVSLEPMAITSIGVRHAWVGLGDLRFEQGTQCGEGSESESESEIEGPVVVDLVPRAELPIDLEDSSYCRVRVRLSRAERLPSGAPEELEDAALVLQGERADGTPFIVRSRREPEAEVRSRGEPFRIETASRSLILAFDVGLWLEGVELDAVEADDDGVIRIDDDNNDELLERFEENVEAAMELFDDRDADGALGDDDVSLASSRD